MAWALWQDATHRAAKMHVAFSVFAQTPIAATVTHGNGSERDQLRKLVQPGGFYVADRGYADYSMFRDFDEQGVRFLIRVQENAAYEVAEERTLTKEDREAGVVQDLILRRLGTEKHNSLLERPLRMVRIQGGEPDHVWLLVTNALELPAELILLAYRFRWQIEISQAKYASRARLYLAFVRRKSGYSHRNRCSCEAGCVVAESTDRFSNAV
jgi:hypothetical protein